MSDEAKGGSAAPEAQASGEQQESQEQATVESSAPTKESVAYDTYRRTLAEAKKAKAQLEEMSEKTNLLEQEKLQSEGKKDELIDNLRKQLADKDHKLKDVYGTFAMKSVTSQVSSEASKMGCVDPDVVNKLMNFESLDIDHDSFTADQQQVKYMLEEIKRDKPYLFQKTQPKIGSHVPNGSAPLGEDISKLSSEQIISKLKDLGWEK